MKRLLARLAALGALLAGLSGSLVGAAPSAGAVTGIESGYWQQRPGPAQVPAGGLEVASDPTGPQAVAAIRFTLDDGESQPVLHLKVAQILPDASQFALVACPVSAKSAGWQVPAGAGAWADAPAADCSGGTSTGSLSSDGTTLTLDLSYLSFPDSTVDIVLTPDLVASPVPSGVVDGVGGQGNPVYDAAFEKVTADQVQVASSPVQGSSGGSSSGLGGGTPSTTGSSTSGGSTGNNLASALPSGSGLSAPAPAAAPAAPPVVAPAPQSVAQQPAAASGPLLVHHGRNWRLIIGIGMVATDLLLVMLFLGRAEGGSAVRPLLSIYDPPPAAVVEPA